MFRSNKKNITEKTININKCKKILDGKKPLPKNSLAMFKAIRKELK